MIPKVMPEMILGQKCLFPAKWSFSEKILSYQLTLERTVESLRDEDCFSKSKRADSR